MNTLVLKINFHNVHRVASSLSNPEGILHIGKIRIKLRMGNGSLEIHLTDIKRYKVKKKK